MQKWVNVAGPRLASSERPAAQLTPRSLGSGSCHSFLRDKGRPFGAWGAEGAVWLAAGSTRGFSGWEPRTHCRCRGKRPLCGTSHEGPCAHECLQEAPSPSGSFTTGLHHITTGRPSMTTRWAPCTLRGVCDPGHPRGCPARMRDPGLSLLQGYGEPQSTSFDHFFFLNLHCKALGLYKK